MVIVGALGVAGLAVVALAIAGLLVIAGWKALRDELWPGFRVSPPSLRTILLVVVGVVLPIGLTAALPAYFAVRLLAMLLTRS